MAVPSYILSNDSLARHQKASIDLIYIPTGAKAGKFAPLAPQALVAYDNAGSPSQAQVDALLGTSSEFVAATVFGSTALGTDAIAMILDCNGQIAAVHSIEIKSVLGTTQASQIGAPVALADTLPVNPRVQLGASGNLALQAVLTGLDAATAGVLLISILVDLK